jgi:hypothetical protein
MAADSEPAALVRELLAEVLQATAAASRWRTLAEILIDQLEQVEQFSAEARTDEAGGDRSDGHDAAPERPPSGSWHHLLSGAGNSPTESQRFDVRGKGTSTPEEQLSP